MLKKKAVEKAEATEAVCPKCKHVRSVQVLPDRPGIVRCTHCRGDFDPRNTLKKVPVSFLGGAEQGVATVNLIQKWSEPDKPRPTLIPQPTRKVWSGSKKDFAIKVVKEMPLADRADPFKRGRAYKAAIREWRPKDGMVEFSPKGLHSSFRQACCLRCLELKEKCNCR